MPGTPCAVLDGMTAYYDVALKRRRHAMLLQSPQFSAHEVMLEDVVTFRRVYEEFAPDIVIHLAAQAGVPLQHREPAGLRRFKSRRDVQPARTCARVFAKSTFFAGVNQFGLWRQRKNPVRKKATTPTIR